MKELEKFRCPCCKQKDAVVPILPNINSYYSKIVLFLIHLG